MVLLVTWLLVALVLLLLLQARLLQFDSRMHLREACTLVERTFWSQLEV